MVHNGVMHTVEKTVRQSVSMPPMLAKQVRSMAKGRHLSKNRMLLELIENGIDAQKRKQQQFLALAERFRNETDPEAANRLGDELGRMVFGVTAATRALGQPARRGAATPDRADA